MRWAGHVVRRGGAVHEGFWWGNRSLGRPRHRWEDNIKMDLKEVGALIGSGLGMGQVAGSCKQ